jgi:hypothetical protein
MPYMRENHEPRPHKEIRKSGRGYKPTSSSANYYFVHGISGHAMAGLKKSEEEPVDHFGSVRLPARRPRMSFLAVTFRLPVRYRSRGLGGIVNYSEQSFAVSRSCYVQLHRSAGGSKHTSTKLVRVECHSVFRGTAGL